ncbi:MAG: methyltransferase domain-containing protein [Pirellulales bacterium]|nr:methyltransferase domain-containing protein [Pirellulales bacterium]
METESNYLYRVFRATEEENRRVIRGLLEPDPQARLLDLGCYDGSWTRQLAETIGTRAVTGVEVSPEAAERARAQGIDVVCADLNGEIPLPEASFDVIHANQVIEHLVETDCFAREIWRLLSPSGYAVVSTNNLASLHNIVSLVCGRQPPPVHVSNERILGNPSNPLHGDAHESRAMSHLRVFSYRALREFLLHHGLVAEVYRTVGFYPFPVPAARIVRWLLPMYGAFLTCKVRKAGVPARIQSPAEEQQRHCCEGVVG